MVKQGIKGIVHFMGWMFKGAAWILIHILKLALAVLSVGWRLTGSGKHWGWITVKTDVSINQ